MCGRFVMTYPVDDMAQLFEAVPSNDLPDRERFNICPTDPVAVVTSEEDARRYRTMRWGFLPHWYKSPSDGPLLINARAETIATKPAFQMACRQRRCLIPATGFYEWTRDADGTRLPWYVHSETETPLVFAGIWQSWTRGADQFVTCAIVTCAAGQGMSDIHHREPVTLAPEDWALWLGEAGRGAALLMRAAPEGRLQAYRVDPKVNANTASGPELILPHAA
ncbi:SOS response-associated peptidase [Rhodophyticola sp. CCM32]|uniref:SOS response-associated peptidase n=1 Tax=Rhodophyticola sp. CCM32 TaxID=2916397 RepID=UPI00107FC4F2|nr:SOS response-associated peptidase [Rhodophyticola sp. CCM32]QBY01496.1 SOS response-associated peptidase [Rhodophyticola sp. CCM32]